MRQGRSSSFVLASLVALGILGFVSGMSCGSSSAAAPAPAQCATGLTVCGGTCADTSSDPRNCGACGTACGAGQACSRGSCVASCANGETSGARPIAPGTATAAA